MASISIKRQSIRMLRQGLAESETTLNVSAQAMADAPVTGASPATGTSKTSTATVNPTNADTANNGHLRSAAHQRSDRWRNLRADRSGLHDGLRHSAPDS